MQRPSDRRLILQRHATASVDDRSISDRDRPLSERGRLDAALVGRHLNETRWIPDLALTSDATRACETWVVVAAELDPQPKVIARESLYLADPGQLAGAVASLPDDIRTAILIAHNPGLEDAAQWLCGASASLDPGSAVLMRSDADSWVAAVAKPGGFDFALLVVPRRLAERRG